MASYIIGENSLTLFHEGEAYQVSQDSDKWDEIVEAIDNEDWDTAIKLANPITALKTYVDGDIRIEGRRLWIGPDEEMHGALAERVLSMHEQGFPIKPMILFIRNLRENPSNRAVSELYRFLEANDLPITNDGYFMAYKRVDENFKDQYTHTIDNSPGAIISMPRNEVNDDCRQTCSHGLHFAGHNYISSYAGTKLIAIKIHPRDVVSIPTDYNDSKGRCCRYEVISELNLSDALAGEEVFNAAVFTATPVPTGPTGTGHFYCAHCKNIITTEQIYSVVDHDGEGFNIHLHCEEAFRKSCEEE